MSPGARAGTFFAALGFLASQLALCIVLNCVSTGMDLAALCPKYINIRRGSYLLTVIAVAVCPWNYVTKASVFITVLSGWSVFLSPMTGILISDYFLVRKQELHVADLYMGMNKSSAYYYNFGFNWRAFVAWAMGLWPLLRMSKPSVLSPISLTNLLQQRDSSALSEDQQTVVAGIISMTSVISSASSPVSLYSGVFTRFLRQTSRRAIRLLH